MAKVTIRIKHVAWREGRPRFAPGPKLRRLGFKGEDLKRADGGWMGVEEAAAWVFARENEIAERRAKKAAGKRLAPIRRAGLVTVGDLVERAIEGRRADLAPRTAQDYREKADTLAQFDPALWASPAAAVTKPIAFGLHDRLRAAKGLPTANKVIAVLRLCWSWGEKRGHAHGNPFLRLGLPQPAPRLRVGTPAEIAALMAAADAGDPARDIKPDPEIGDAIVLALYSGQRQADVLAYEDRNASDGRIRLIQSKTGARVSVPALAPLVERLAAARARKAALVETHRLKETPPQIVICARTRRAFLSSSFQHRYADLRAVAAKTCPSVKTLNFQDLRDTAVTRLATAGCTMPEIAAITGHSLETITTVLKHYLALNEAMADAAMRKLADWLEKEGVAV